MSTIFISHSSADNDAAAQLKARLADWGYRSFFLDFDPDSGIAAGQRWENTLYVNIKSAQAVIVLCSPASMSSRWCFAEIAMAKAQRKDIFPVRIDPRPFDVYPVLTEFQSIDLTPSGAVEAAYQRLRGDLRKAGLDPEDDFDWEPATQEPYPGLSVFEKEDAGIYFGRIDEAKSAIATLERLRRGGGPRCAVLIGASGSGKSSLLRAGIRPRLEKEAKAKDWVVLPPFRPKKRPLEELARALTEAFAAVRHNLDWQSVRDQLRDEAAWNSPGEPREPPLSILAKDLTLKAARREATPLLLIDQYEELLDDRQGEECACFLRLLHRTLTWEGSPLLVLATLPSASLEAFQQHVAGTTSPLGFEPILLEPLAAERFPLIIEGPARRAGLDLDAGLATRMAADTGTGAALPLLAFTLRELRHRCRSDSRLTLAAYEALGGIRGAVTSVAQRIEAEVKLSTAETDELRAVLVRLARLNDEGRFVRQALRWEVGRQSANVNAVLTKCVEARLLAERGEAGQRVLEVVHETLFDVWPRLKKWLDEERAAKELQRRLREAAREWGETGDASRLYRGQRLLTAWEWLERHRAEVQPQEEDFLAASRRAERRRRRLYRELRASLIGVVLLLVAGAGWLYYVDSERDKLQLKTELQDEQLKSQQLRVERTEEAEKTNLALAYFSRALQAQQQRDFPLAKLALSRALTIRDMPEVRGRLAENWFTARLLWEAALPRTDPQAERPPLPRAVLFAADGKTVLSAGDDHHIDLWDAATGHLHTSLNAESPVRALALRGNLLAAGCKDGRVRLFDLEKRQLLRQFRVTKPILSVAISSTGAQLALGVEGDGLHVLDAATGIEQTYVANGYSAPGVSFGPGDRQVAWVGKRFLHLSSVVAGENEGIVGQQQSDLSAVVWGVEQQAIAAAGHDRTITIWSPGADENERPSPILFRRAATREHIRELVGHEQAVTALAFSASGTKLVSGGRDGEIRLWDWRAKRLELLLNNRSGGILSVAASPREERVAVVGRDARVQVWELRHTHGAPLYDHTALPDYNPQFHANPSTSNFWIEALQFLNADEVAVQFPTGRSLRVGVASGQRLGELTELDARFLIGRHGVRLSPDGRRVAVLARETISVAQAGAKSSEEVVKLPQVHSVDWSPDSEALLLGMADGAIQQLALKTPQVRETLLTHKGEPTILARVAAPARVAVGWDDGTVAVWDFSGRKRIDGPPRGEAVARAAFAPTGKQLALTTRGGGGVRIWDVEEAKEVARLDRQAASVAFSPNGQWLAVGSIVDGKIWLHRTSDFGLAGVLEGHTRVVTALAFSPDSALLLSGSEDNTVRRWSVTDLANLWTTEPRQLLATAEQEGGMEWRELEVRPRALSAATRATARPAGVAVAPAETAAALCNEASQMLKRERDFDKAVQLAEQAVAAVEQVVQGGKPTETEVRLWIGCRVVLGDALHRKELLDRALNAYREAVEQPLRWRPDFGAAAGSEWLRAHDALARSLTAAKKPAEAHDVAVKAIRLHRQLIERGQVDVVELQALEGRYLELIRRLESEKKTSAVIELYRELLTILHRAADKAAAEQERRGPLLPGQSAGTLLRFLNQGVAVNEERLGDLLFGLEREEEAIRNYAEAIKRREALAKDWQESTDRERAARTLGLTRFKAAMTAYGVAEKATPSDPKLWQQAMTRAEEAKAFFEGIKQRRALTADEREGLGTVENIIKEVKPKLPRSEPKQP